jgi:AmiR/NasT family two-component response regulator
MTQTAPHHSPSTKAAHSASTDSGRRAADANAAARHRSLLMIGKSSASRDLAGTLDKAGIDVVGQSTATDDALGLAANCRPDTLLVHVCADDNMPALFAGAQLGLPLVVLADSADPELVRRAIAAGAMGYVVAPFTAERLIPTLEVAAARNADVSTLRATVTDIRDRLDTRKVVERAKGLLMAHEKLSEQDAFRFIQRTAMDRRSSMRDVANAITQRISGAA